MKGVGLYLILSILLLIWTGVTAQSNQPNVLIICVDDMKDWVGYLQGYEGSVYTPNIDQLAKEGVAFTNAHTASTVCCPSRNAFLLGKRPSSTGLYNNGQWWKPAYPDEKPMPQYFKENGYYVAGAGKVFHETPGNNPPCGWDEYQDFIFDSKWNFADWSVERYTVTYGYRGPIGQNPDFMPLNDMYPIRSPLDWGVIPDKPESEYGDVLAADYAKDFLKRDHEQPFFLAIGIFHPHLPWYVPQKYFDMYPLDEVRLPSVYEDDLEDLPAIPRNRMTQHPHFNRIKETGKWKEAVRAYLASISFADSQVGAVYDALKGSQYADNTIVVFWSDHGWHLGSKEQWHKFTLWEESTHIPFVIKAPKVAGNGQQCSKPVDMVNVYPTLLSLCNFPEKEDLEGHDLTPLLENPEGEWVYPAISESSADIGGMAVRSQNWRYIRYSDGTEELYDRNKDPEEWKNLSDEPQYKEILKEHRKWIPEYFAPSVPNKTAYFFDPYQYTWLNKASKEFIEGRN